MRGRVNYFMGGEPSKWRTDIPIYAQVSEHDVWKGIDQLWYGNDGQLECDFVMRPGADPAAISLALEGATKASLNRQGGLIVSSGGPEFRLLKPAVYQRRDGVKHAIPGGYVLSRTRSGEFQVAFKIGSYDRAEPLVIDPVITYLTYFGGSGQLSTDS
jgi:hypothetical protein